RQEREDLLGRKCQQLLGQLPGSFCFSPELMQCRCPAEGDALAEWMRNLPGDGDGLLAVAQRLVGVAQVPEDASEKRMAIGGAIEPVACRCGAAPLRIVQSDALVQVSACRGQLSGKEVLDAQFEMGVGEELGVAQASGEFEQLLPQPPPRPQVSPQHV